MPSASWSWPLLRAAAVHGPARCRYVGEWLAVKLRWRLTVDTAERNALISCAGGCPDVTITVTRAR